MPIYEYGCSTCDCQFELMRPFSQSGEDAVCPQCRNHAQKKLSVFAVFSKDASGMSTPVGAGSCAGCSSTGCDTCGV